MEQFETLRSQWRHTEHIHEGVNSKKVLFDEMTPGYENIGNFPVNVAFVYALIVP